MLASVVLIVGFIVTMPGLNDISERLSLPDLYKAIYSYCYVACDQQPSQSVNKNSAGPNLAVVLL